MGDKPVTDMIVLTSAGFEAGAAIPRKFTCDGADVSPPLAWSDVPAGTAELALVVDDPDAPGGTFVHWVLYRLPADLSEIGEGSVPGGALQGPNDFGRNAWGGPCPPKGPPHRYVFTVYAVSKKLTLGEGATAGELEEAMRGSVLAQGRLTGTYGRS